MTQYFDAFDMRGLSSSSSSSSRQMYEAGELIHPSKMREAIRGEFQLNRTQHEPEWSSMNKDQLIHNTEYAKMRKLASDIELGLARLDLNETKQQQQTNTTGHAFLISDKIEAAAGDFGPEKSYPIKHQKKGDRPLSRAELLKKGYVRFRIEAVGPGSWGAPTTTGPTGPDRSSSGMISMGRLSVLSPANLEFGNTGVKSQTFEQNTLGMAFGKTHGGSPLDPHSQFGMTHYHMPKDTELIASSMNLSIIMDNVFQAGAALVLIVLPWKEWDPSIKYEFEQWIFDSGTAQRASYESAQRMMTSRRQRKSYGMLFWGIAQQSELHFWRTKTGQLHWALQKIQMKNAIVETACMGAQTEINTCRATPTNRSEKQGRRYTESEWIKLIAAEFNQIDCIKREKHGLDYCVGLAKKVFQKRNINYRGTLTFLLPDGIKDYVVQTPEKTVYILTGIPRDRFDANLSIPDVARTIPTRPFLTNTLHGKPVDLNEEHVVSGRHGISYSGIDMMEKDEKAFESSFKSDDLDYQHYNFDLDRITTIGQKALFRASCLYKRPRNSENDNTLDHSKYDLTMLGHKYFFDWIAHSAPGAEGEKYKNQSWHPRHQLESNVGHSGADASLRRFRIPAEAKAIIGGYARAGDHRFVMNVASFYEHGYVGSNRNLLDKVARRILYLHQSSPKFWEHFDDHVLQPAMKGWTKDKGRGPDAKSENALNHIKEVLNNVSLHTAHYFEFCYQNNIPTFLWFKISQPWMAFKALCINALADIGYALGSTLVGRGMYLVGITPKTGMVSGTATYHCKSNVENEALVHNLKGVFITGYLEGGNDEFLCFEDLAAVQMWRRNPKPRGGHDRYVFCFNKPRGTMFAEVQPLGSKEEFPPYMAHSGRWNPEFVDVKDLEHPWQTETAEWYAELWGRVPPSYGLYTADETFYNDMRPVEGDITYQEHQLHKTREGGQPAKFKKWIEDRGFLPSKMIQTGMTPYINGEKPLTTTTLYTNPASGIVQITETSY